MNFSIRHVFASLLVFFGIVPCVLGSPLSIADAFRPAAITSMKLSPDGRYIAAIGRVTQTTALILINTETLASEIIGQPASGAKSTLAVHWVDKDLLAIDTPDSVRVIDLSGKQIYKMGGTYLGTVTPDEKGRERFVVWRRYPSLRIERVDAQTGRTTLMTAHMPGTPLHWLVDREGAPLVATTKSTAVWSDDTTVTHWYRRSLQDKWEPLAKFAATEVAWKPAYLTRDGKSLVISSAQGRDTTALFRYDLQERRIAEMLAGHPTEDINYAEGAEETDDYLRVVTEGMKPEIYWFDGRWDGLQRSVDQALPGRINWLTGDSAGRVLVKSHADVDPGRWYLLDTKTATLKEVAAVLPHINPDVMLSKRIVSYRSADGLLIPAYLTEPRNARGQLPTVVLVHGGPVARDHWDWDPEVQLLASRGYAVLQPQFRGSSGFGWRFEVAGYGQWGLAMQDDISAGVKWLVAEGIADPARICIYGASYGGYAAMWGMAKTPELFRCGISFAGVSDLAYMLKDDSDVNDYAIGRLQTRKMLSDPTIGQQQFDEVSPLKQVASINAPVLIAHGDRDARVPIMHSEKLVNALRAHKKEFEWIELKGEGHGIAKEENQQRFYQTVFDFLAKHIGDGMSGPGMGASSPAASTARP